MVFLLRREDVSDESALRALKDRECKVEAVIGQSSYRPVKHSRAKNLQFPRVDVLQWKLREYDGRRAVLNSQAISIDTTDFAQKRK